MAIFGFFQGAKKFQLFKNHKIALTYLYGLTMKNEGNLFYPTLKVGVKSYLTFLFGGHIKELLMFFSFSELNSITRLKKIRNKP